MNKKRQPGFTLTEVMITMAVIAILMTIAYPSFQGQMRKARRSEAIAKMQDIQLLQERWRTNNTNYGQLTDFGMSNPEIDDHYEYTIEDRTPTTYTVRAVPTGDQENDATCGDLTDGMSIDQSNVRLPARCF